MKILIAVLFIFSSCTRINNLYLEEKAEFKSDNVRLYSVQFEDRFISIPYSLSSLYIKHEITEIERQMYGMYTKVYYQNNFPVQVEEYSKHKFNTHIYYLSRKIKFVYVEDRTKCKVFINEYGIVSTKRNVHEYVNKGETIYSQSFLPAITLKEKGKNGNLVKILVNFGQRTSESSNKVETLLIQNNRKKEIHVVDETSSKDILITFNELTLPEYSKILEKTGKIEFNAIYIEEDVFSFFSFVD